MQVPQAGGYLPILQLAAAPLSSHSGPHDFLMLSLVTTIICAILNLISLAFGIPAIIFAIMVGLIIAYVGCTVIQYATQSVRAKNTYFKDYPRAKKYARNALILTVLNIIFTLCMVLLILGLTVGFQCASQYGFSSEYDYRLRVYNQ